MTETRIIVDLDREATPDQIMTLQDGIEASVDHVVGDTLVPDRGYAGMLASYAGTVVTVGAGRLYSAGKVYAFDQPATFDVLAAGKLPVATRRIMLIIAFGQEQDAGAQPVNYVVESQSTPTAIVYKPQTVATTHQRLAVVQDAYGDEAANPVYPAYGLALPVAVAVLGPAGIVSLQNIVDGQVPNLADLASRVKALEGFEATVGPEISTLSATLAGLANARDYAPVISRILLRQAATDAKLGIPDAAADSDMDYLLDGSNSDLAHPLSNCRVEEGIRFPDDNAADQVLQRFNPFETTSVIKGGVLLPAYDRYLRQSTGPQTGSVRANGYTYNAVSYTQKTIARTRVRYGPQFGTCTNSDFWKSGTYDPITGIFKLPDGETFKAAFDPTAGVYSTNGAGEQSHVFVRLQEYWTDTVDETYWDAVVQPPQTIPGFHLAESWLCGQDQWLDAVGFHLAALDAQGDVTVLVCQAGDDARPDPSSVLASVTIPFASLAVGANVASLATPVLLEANQHVAVVVVTTAAHSVGTTDGADFPQGTFFALSPSGYAAADLTKHLQLDLYSCKFRQSVCTVQLQNLQLGGGITGIDILASAIVPGACNLVYGIQIAGVVVPLGAQTTAQLNAGGALNPNIPLFATFVGTPDMMPALDLAHSNAHVSRPKTGLAHVWPLQPRTPPMPSSQIRVIGRYEGYDPAQHSWAVKLLTGTGYGTQTAPSSFSDVSTADGALERTYVFNLGAAVSSYKVLTLGTATTPLDVDLGAWIKDYVL